MKAITKKRKKAMKHLGRSMGSEWMAEQLVNITTAGKQALDTCMLELGRMVAESIMYLEREELAGPEYQPKDSKLKKWASQRGSIYLGGSKVPVEHPRLRGPHGEVALQSYQSMRDPTQFSEELLTKVLCGLSGRRYHETIVETAQTFGVSAGSVSNRVMEASAQQLSTLLERKLGDITLFALFLDTVHRGGRAFVVALGLDVWGQKHALGFWEGATENHAICQALLSDLESRGLKLGKQVLFITDGGRGMKKCLKERYGEDLMQQRCTIHKDRNIQAHLPKRYRAEAHRRFRIALQMKHYDDAKAELMKLEQWLRAINESAADSLLEAREEILTLHRLGVPELLRKTVHSTNPIESLFSQVRHMEKNIKRYRSSKMARRWLGSTLLYAEKKFRTVKGYRSIPGVIKIIEHLQQKKKTTTEMKQAA